MRNIGLRAAWIPQHFVIVPTLGVGFPGDYLLVLLACDSSLFGFMNLAKLHLPATIGFGSRKIVSRGANIGSTTGI
jgi:hypothetical protein